MNNTIWLGDTERAVQFDTEEFRSAGAGAVCDAGGKRGALSSTLRPMTGASSFAGRALTVLSEPNDNLVPYLALDYMRKGDVVVIATSGQQAHTALLGGIITGHMRNIGVVGVVTDGLVRDIREIEALGLPLFAAGVSSAAPEKCGAGAIGTPVIIGGVLVSTGDLVVGDRDGVTVVPMDDVSTVAQKLSQIEAKERRAAETIARGDLCPIWLEEMRGATTVLKL